MRRLKTNQIGLPCSVANCNRLYLYNVCIFLLPFCDNGTTNNLLLLFIIGYNISRAGCSTSKFKHFKLQHYWLIGIWLHFSFCLYIPLQLCGNLYSICLLREIKFLLPSESEKVRFVPNPLKYSQLGMYM